MQTGPDLRIPILFGGDGEMFLVEEGFSPQPRGKPVVYFAPGLSGHVRGCACCAPRHAVATALAALHRDRAMGKLPFFSRLVVLASPAGEAAVREVLAADVLARARYREAGGVPRT